MFILIVLLLSLGIALARGGRLDALVNLPVRQLWLFFVPLLLQLMVFTPVASLFGSSTDVARFVYLASMLTAALALALNRQLPGLLWIAAGLVLNVLVITANGGFMPVLPAAREFAGMAPLSGRDNNVILMGPDTSLWFLGDLLPLPAWMPLANVFSLGDVLITLGGVLFIQRALIPPRHTIENTSDA